MLQAHLYGTSNTFTFIVTATYTANFEFTSIPLIPVQSHSLLVLRITGLATPSPQ